MSTSCQRTRRVLWPGPGPQAASPAVLAAHEHLSMCRECRAFFDSMAQLAALVRRSTDVQAGAPLATRNRVFDAIARARTGRRGWFPAGRKRWMAVAAGIALAIGGLVHWLPPRSHGSLAGTIDGLVENHARRQRDDVIRSGDAATVSRWLRARVPFAVDIPVFPDVPLAGARISRFDGTMGAVVEFTEHRRPISYFVLPQADVRNLGTGIDAVPPPRLGRVGRGGYNVVFWREGALVHAFVGDLPASRLEWMAKECIRQMMVKMALR